MAVREMPTAMTEATSTGSEWLNWIEVQKRATRLWMQQKATEAIAELNRFLSTDPPPDLKRDAIAFRGSIYQEQGAWGEAKSDALAALAISEEHQFARYSIELTLAAICERLGDAQGAEDWCLAGLRTAAEDPRESGAGVLQRLLRLRGEKGLSNKERDLVRQVVYQAWHLLRIEGEPDLNQLPATAKKLLRAQRGPFSAERPPRPKKYDSTEDG